ncbi:DNA polymerase III subunit alpha [Chitinispirillales bacterium ANBcel5]|uniref:DNA polymerase III subunit alpha n=1 Tax=Cellulosispirillum alkaliphilum TaxID=3039283 RepID=UPI002A5631F7|nr:DNA polymerase III subunit alpha [Chitinispirillales bacterium ANBcel5]
MSSNFVSLHNHTEYSFLDGAIKIKELVKQAKAFEMPALAITDHGGVFGAVEFFEACQSEDIKPVLGFEAYVAPNSRKEKTLLKDERNYCHLILLARNNTGWKNLMRLSTIGYLEGFYYKPRIDMEVLREYSEGIIATSACVAGAIPQAVLEGNLDKARNLIHEHLSIFGEDNFYLELQNHGIEDEIIANEQLISLGKEIGVPFIVANDAHYLRKEDAISHEVLLCIQTQTTMNDPNRYRFSSDQIYFKSPQEMAQLFPDIPEAMSNTLEIAQRCDVSIKEKPQLPVPDLPKGFEKGDEYLAALSRQGLKEKYENITPEIEERLEYELEIIRSMGFPGYFLIVRDFVLAAQKQGVMVGCRGSAAGSLVAYVTGITSVDPIKFDLIFERFLNPERVSMPDADIDFADRDRYKVIDYVIDKYGRDAVCQIINFGRMKAKMVVKDVARAMGIPVAEANRLSSLVNEKNLEKSLGANPDLAKAIESNSQYGELFKHASVLEGLARQAGMHAGGVIIAPGDVVKWSPLFKQPGSGVVMTQFDMNYVEKVGLIKMDFLGLRTLTVLQESLRLIKKYHDRDIDLWNLSDGDQKTYELFGRGETTGVFQFESSGMQEYLRKLKPTCIEDLIAMAALYRPGPMDNIDTFIARKHGKETINYLHPMLEEILDVTYGVIIYQEQVMRIAQNMGGFSLGQADILRKAMGKKNAAAMEEMGKKFIDGAKNKGIDPKTAKSVFDLMAKFAEYGFNKAHATVYAHVSYQAAYLKAHYPLEYMTANLTSWLGSPDGFLTMRNEANRMGIKILPPDINRSEDECSIDNSNIRLGMGAVKNVGKSSEAIITARKDRAPFHSIFDLCKTVDLRSINKKSLESLICAGAMDCLEGTRAQLSEAIDKAIDFGASFQKDKISGQANLFEDMFDNQNSAETIIPEPSLPEINDWPYNILLQKEKEILGFYVSGHPLDRYFDEIKGFSTISLEPEKLADIKDGKNATVGGMITSFKPYTQKNGKQMAFLQLENLDGSIELLVFGDAYEKFHTLLGTDAMVLVHGQISHKNSDDKPKLRVENCIALDEAREKLTRSVHIKLSTDSLEKEKIEDICNVCNQTSGECSLIVHLLAASQNEYHIKAGKIKVAPSENLLNELKKKLGKENVWISKTAA